MSIVWMSVRRGMLSPNLPKYSGTASHRYTLCVIRPLVRLLLRTVHRARVDGGKLPTSGGLIVIANHVSGIDALLLQTWCARPIRFLMDRAQMHPIAGWLWRLLRIIPVDDAGGSSTLRESLRELAQGGVIGIFPEGQIARPPGRIQVFRPGLAALARKTRAAVAVYVIDGVPPCGNPFVSLFRPSRARMRLVMVMVPPLSAEEDEPWTLSLREAMGEALRVPVDTLPSG